MEVNDNVLNLLSEMGQGRVDFEASYHFSEDLSLNELHTHSFYEFYFHVQGGRILHTDTQVYTLEPNSFFIFPPFTLHGMIGEEHLTNYERAFLYVSTNLLDTLSANMLDFQKILSLVTSGQPSMFILSPERHSECVRMIKEISELCKTKSLFSLYLANTKIAELLLKVLSYITKDGETIQPSPGSSDSLVRDVAKYVSDNYNTDLSLDAIAAHFSTNKYNICHRFSEVYHCSLHQFILHKRVSKARENIALGRSLTDAAYDSGFGDYSSFLRAFTKVTKMTPTEYRNNCLNREKIWDGINDIGKK